jgi:hypothetical protein
MARKTPRLGDPLADDDIIFRAFSAKGFRERSKKVRAGAYYRSKDHEDGLSLGKTPESAVAGLGINYGYCSISVGFIHSLRYGLKVKPDLDNPGHLVLCGLPCIDSESDEERGIASEIAGKLAKNSELKTSDHYPPKETAGSAPPTEIQNDPATQS